MLWLEARVSLILDLCSCSISLSLAVARSVLLSKGPSTKGGLGWAFCNICM